MMSQLPYKYQPYSFSKLEVAACPYRFKRQYIDKDMPPELEPKGGRAVHEAAKMYVDECVKAKQGSMVDLIDGIWDKATEQEKLTADDGDYIEMFGRFCRSTIIVPSRVLATELEVAFKADFSPCGWWDKDAFFRMKIDRLETLPNDPKIPVVIDYKTQFNLPSQSEVEEKQTQMRTYAWGLMRTLYPDAPVVHVSLVYPRWYCAERSLDINRDAADRQQKTIMSKIKKIEGTTSWEPMAGGVCDFCPLIVKGCPLGARNPAAVVTVENVKEVANWYVQQKAEVAKVAKALQKFCAARGNVDAGNSVVGYFEKKSTKVDTPKAVAWLRANAPDLLDEVISIPMTGLEKKAGDKFATLMEAAGVTKVGSEFGIEGKVAE
jgi:hypothetical protein